MAIQESSRLDLFGNRPQNYLLDWARRTNNVSNMANYTVEVRQDDSTGLIYGYIHDVADAPASVDPAVPAPIDLAPGDPVVAIENQEAV